MTRVRAWPALLLSLATATAGCERQERGAHDRTPAAAHALAMASDTPAAGSAHALPRASLEPGALRTVASAPVVGFRGPGGAPFEVAIRTADRSLEHVRLFGRRELQLALRTRSPAVSQYPCTSCHLGRRIDMADERIADAHQDIRPVHPARVGATCATCHAPDDVELLALKSGERATLAHTYRLCAQCHFEQAEAWAGGGHGKRLDGWQGRRVVMGCADCHEPHDPTLERRVPFRAPRLERTRSPER